MATPIPLRIFSALHRSLYRVSGGRLGGKTFGVPILLLTTTGKKTGKQRTTPLMYGVDGERLVLIASKGGAPEHPAWYGNLVAQPAVDVLVGREKRTMRARNASAEERPRLWRMMADKYKGYDEYMKKTTREIPVVVLEPAR
jgi:F420H(2)-dependent quinone reductase